MRCTVCGRQTRFHRHACYSLQRREGGKWVTTQVAHSSKCTLIRSWQTLLIYGGTMRIAKVACTPDRCPELIWQASRAVEMVGEPGEAS